MSASNSNETKSINYCDDFICTYHMHDEEDQDDIYKCQIIQAFMIDDWRDDKVNKTVRKLFKEFTNESNPHYLENKAQMERLYEKMNGYLFPTDTNNINNKKKQFVLFQYLFGFDYFFKTHSLICNFLNNNKVVSSEIIDEFVNQHFSY